MDYEIVFLHETDSTNLEVIRRYEKGDLKVPSVVVADYQTAGKGYDDHYWESEKGKNLLISMAWKPVHIEPSGQFVITQIVSLALTDLLKNILGQEKKIKIKWPNDIYVNDRKIAGILIQNYIQGDQIDLSVIGVGFNVNQKQFLPETPNPTSVLLETGKIFDTKTLLQSLLKKFNAYYYKNLSSTKEIGELYHNQLYRLDELSHFKIGENKTVTGIIRGVNGYGQLLFQMENGPLRAFHFKEIEYII